MINLIDTTFAGKNISTAISVYEYTVLAVGYLGFQVRLDAVAGGGDYICYLKLNDGDLQTDDVVTPKVTYTAEAGETAFWFANLAVDVLPGDVVNVFVKGLAGDVSESGSIRIFSDNYAVNPLGSGSIAYTPNGAIDPDSNPIDGVDTWINTDSADSSIGVVARAYTNALGLIASPFMLDPGTYYVWRQHGSYSFSNPQTVVVA